MYLLEYMVGEVTVQEVWLPLWHGPIEDYKGHKYIKVINTEDENKIKDESSKTETK